MDGARAVARLPVAPYPPVAADWAPPSAGIHGRQRREHGGRGVAGGHVRREGAHGALRHVFRVDGAAAAAAAVEADAEDREDGEHREDEDADDGEGSAGGAAAATRGRGRRGGVVGLLGGGARVVVGSVLWVRG